MKLANPDLHLAYCTNIHPAESWVETLHVLETQTLKVRDSLVNHGVIKADEPYAIGLRLSARAAAELLAEGLSGFRRWLDDNCCYVFTINGFPYGDFHGKRIKEKVYQPDWTEDSRLAYTRDLFHILAGIAERGTSASVSTLPGSFKPFQADTARIVSQLRILGNELEDLSELMDIDFHLGLEPEPLGHFEDTAETLRFFDRLLDDPTHQEHLKRRIGINYDSCHFAVEFDDPVESINAFSREGLRLSKIHASNALALDPRCSEARDAIRAFDEDHYLHQVIARFADGERLRFKDLPEAFTPCHLEQAIKAEEWRVHFHIPLFCEPQAPLRSTADHLLSLCRLMREGKIDCSHWEFETYTWAVLPDTMQAPMVDQLREEYHWLLSHLK